MSLFGMHTSLSLNEKVVIFTPFSMLTPFMKNEICNYLQFTRNVKLYLQGLQEVWKTIYNWCCELMVFLLKWELILIVNIFFPFFPPVPLVCIILPPTLDCILSLVLECQHQVFLNPTWRLQPSLGTLLLASKALLHHTWLPKNYYWEKWDRFHFD